MTEVISSDATGIEGLEACFFDDDFVQGEVLRGKESTAGRWTHAEHEMFVRGLELHSKQWKLIAELIKTRTVVQVRTHAQKYFQKLLKQAKSDGSLISEDAFADLFNDTSSDLIAGLKRKNSNSSFSVKSKVKRTESNTSLNSEGCTSRGSSESDLRRGPDGEKKRKLKPDGSKSPTSRLINDSDSEPYLNSYPIQVSNGSSYPQTNVITEGNNSADWFNLPPTAPQSHGQSQRYQQSIPVNNNYNLLPTYSDPTSYNSDPSNYTHGICCNATTANYYQSQSYPHAPHTQTVIQNHNNISQQMDFPDPFGIGGGDFNSVDRGDFTDLIWYDIDDLRENVQEERPYNSNVQVSFSKESISQSHDGSGFQQQTQQSHVQVADAVISRNESSNNISNSNSNNNINNSNNNNRYSAETSSAFGSSEAYTSYEESSLTSCTSSDDGCFDDFDISPSNDQSISDAMAIITNSQKRRLSKSSLALNNMTSYATETETETETESTPLPLITESEEKSLDTTWLFKEDDEDLVSGIVEAFST